ncbi:MAG: hypothetical protein H6518_13360 [Microthrixaceae bacterium]|nr:hypothetical protein [Microthrixaceae bacterium]
MVTSGPPDGGGVALVQKTHHALIDGLSGIDVATVLLETEPDRRWSPEWTPEPAVRRPFAGRQRGLPAVAGQRHGSVRRRCASCPEQTGERPPRDHPVGAGRALLASRPAAAAHPWNARSAPARRYEVAGCPSTGPGDEGGGEGVGQRRRAAICAGALLVPAAPWRARCPTGAACRRSCRSRCVVRPALLLGTRCQGCSPASCRSAGRLRRACREVCGQMAAVKRSGQAEVADRSKPSPTSPRPRWWASPRG